MDSLIIYCRQIQGIFFGDNFCIFIVVVNTTLLSVIPMQETNEAQHPPILCLTMKKDESYITFRNLVSLIRRWVILHSSFSLLRLIYCLFSFYHLLILYLFIFKLRLSIKLFALYAVSRSVKFAKND